MTNNSPVAEAKALEYLKSALPLADQIALSEDALRRVARHALQVRACVPWGESVPEDVFLPYVLFPRVNNEDPVFYHGPIWRQLSRRIDGLEMTDAVQEINRWCYEQATYQSTDVRTANALTVMRRGFGRCGEESVLLVSALRACGIPARQVYVPLWSHCDDNHAWVEAWVDGTWRYLGACEPELSLDSGWFTAAASKAMLVHTRAYGILPEGERAENHIDSAWVINRTAAYAQTRLLTVRVLEDGRPKPGVRVDFELANMAVWQPICSKTTDECGCADLLTGLGTLHIWVTDGTGAAEAFVDVAQTESCTVDWSGAALPASGMHPFQQRPPRESRIQPARFPREAVTAHERWLADAERVRQARFALPESADMFVRSARGNREVIDRFLERGPGTAEDRRALLASLREKDLVDATEEMLSDALEGAMAWKDEYPRDVWEEGVLCPRIRNEMLYPLRRWLRERLPSFTDASAVWRWLCDRIALCRMDPPTLTPNLRAALEYGRCSEAVRDVAFVAVCRANGLAARLEPTSGEKQVWREGGWHALLSAREPDARLVLRNAGGGVLTSGVHFSVSALEEGAYRALEMYGDALEREMTLSLPAGRYRVMTAFRQIDGSLEGWTQYVEIGAQETLKIDLPLSEDHTAEKLIRAPLPALQVDSGDGKAALPGALDGHAAIVACIAPGQEPTEHFLNELLEAREGIGSRGISVQLLIREWEQANNEKLQKVLRDVPGARCLASPDDSALTSWRTLLNAGDLRLPLAVAIGRKGEGLFAFVNYNVGSVKTLIQIIDAE